jgi:hypothetical protein
MINEVLLDAYNYTALVCSVVLVVVSGVVVGSVGAAVGVGACVGNDGVGGFLGCLGFGGGTGATNKGSVTSDRGNPVSAVDCTQSYNIAA